MGFLSTLGRRVAADYLAPSRIEEYRDLLRRALVAGYEVGTLRDFYPKRGGDLKPGKYLALRHDVDLSSPDRTQLFMRVEREFNVKSTYYFRLRTYKANLAMISKLQDAGFEVGYHYEEPATLAKRSHCRSFAELQQSTNEIIDTFESNLRAFEKATNQKCVSICAHGDWINRRLGFCNDFFVSDDVLTRNGLHFEAYQLARFCDAFVSDPDDFRRHTTEKAGLLPMIGAELQRIIFVSHERCWFRDSVANTAENMRRALETIRYSL